MTVPFPNVACVYIVYTFNVEFLYMENYILEFSEVYSGGLYNDDILW